MIGASGVFPKAFAVWFKDIDRWDPASFHRISWHWPNHLMVPIGSVLRVRKERVDKSAFKFSELQPITIHFDGSIDKRTVAANREYTMDLWYARPGDIVVAKIDLKNGAVGIVPPNWTNVVVTNHFAVYEPDLSRLLPEYLQRLIQTRFFKAHLWRNKVGAEGRKEVKLGFFEQEKIPLPPLAQQKAIVARWRKAQREMAGAAKRVTKHKATIDAQFVKDLGLRPLNQVSSPKAFAVLWKDFLRWGVSFNKLNQHAHDLEEGRYPVVRLGSVLDLIQYGTSEKANSRGVGLPVLRIINIKDGTLDLSELKHIDLPQKSLDSLILRDGDVLIIRTSGSRDLVGTCAVFHGEKDFVFASYLIRLRFDLKKADPEFVSWFINSPLGRQQVDAVSRQIMMNNINAEELRNLQIPLPPLAVQEQIMQHVSRGRLEIAREREAAKRIEKNINQDIEALILGIEQL